MTFVEIPFFIVMMNLIKQLWWHRVYCGLYCKETCLNMIGQMRQLVLLLPRTGSYKFYCYNFLDFVIPSEVQPMESCYPYLVLVCFVAKVARYRISLRTMPRGLASKSFDIISPSYIRHHNSTPWHAL